MGQRADNLVRMALTIASALLVGLIVEADGLRVWADRLTVGLLRDMAQPATRRWVDLTHPLHLNALRQWALQGKEDLSTAMLAVPRSDEAQPAAVVEKESVPVHAQPAVHMVASRNDEGGTERIRADEASLSPAIASTTAPVAQRDAASAARSSSATGIDNAELAMLARPVRVSASVTLQLPPLGLPREVQVALAGDSMMAVGLAPTLTRGLTTEKNVHLVRAYRSGTGLARPEVLDWLVEYPRMLGANTPDVVICAIGANDAQNVQVGKQVLQFGSPQWNDFFRQRLTAYLDMLTRDHARVLWLAMPVMKVAAFSQKIDQINAVARATVAQYPGVTWLDVSTALGYAKDGFHQFRADERGRLIKLRADDGIHLTDDGAAYLLPPIRDWLARAATTSAVADE
jgi:hypothetical protein